MVEGITVLLGMFFTLDTFTIQIRAEDGEKVHFFKYYSELVEYYPGCKTASKQLMGLHVEV